MYFMRGRPPPAGGSLDARSWVHPVESNTAVWSAKLKRGFGAAWRLLNRNAVTALVRALHSAFH